MYADDGSGWYLRTNSAGDPQYVIAKNGTLIPLSFGRASSVRDPNGNQISTGGGSITDTAGRAFPSDGLTYYDSSGAAQTIQITYTNVPVQTNVCLMWSLADRCNEFSGTLSLPSQVTLPNGGAGIIYGFSYVQSGMGEPSSVTLPTGGQISWTWIDGDQAGRRVATRTTTSNGQSFTWTYSYQTGFQPVQQVNSIVAPIVPPDTVANETVYTWTTYASYGSSNPIPYVATVKVYSGSASSGQLLKTAATDYSTSSTILPIRETTTWNQQNLTSKVETDWDSFVVSGTTVTARNVVNRREYDWGSAGPLLRTTSFNYLHLVNTSYLSANIVDRATLKTIYYGSSNQMAQTSNSYDAPTLIATSGAPNHDYTNFGTGNLVRGNLNQTQRWLNTNGTWVTTTNVYDDLGNLRSTTDPAGHTVSFSYSDNFSDGGNRNAQTYITQITYPTTGVINHIERKQYFWNTGRIAASCGQNFPGGSLCANTYAPPQPDYTKYIYDVLNRLLSVTRADGGQTSYNYNDSAPVSVVSTETNNPNDRVKTVVYDGLARVKQTQLNSNPGCVVYVDTTYDALSRKAIVRNPYCTTADPTYGITSFQYDALSRVTKLIPPDGTSSTNNVSTVYASNCTTVTDQAGKTRKTCTDSLGRLTQVFEPDANGNFVYETDYVYDALNNLTCAEQHGNVTGTGCSSQPSNDATSPWRVRRFNYNSLSQLTSAANPEISSSQSPPQICAITYSYDNDGNVLTKVTPAPNQPNCTPTLTTTYSYDELDRVTQKSYSDGTTPTVQYGYDAIAPSGCTPPALTINNGVGRRTSMCDAAGAEAWSYDAIGRAQTDRRTTNSITKDTLYGYNLDGSIATLTYPGGRMITYQPAGAGRPLWAKDLASGIRDRKSTRLNSSH